MRQYPVRSCRTDSRATSCCCSRSSAAVGPFHMGLRRYAHRIMCPRQPYPPLPWGPMPRSRQGLRVVCRTSLVLTLPYQVADNLAATTLGSLLGALSPASNQTNTANQTSAQQAWDRPCFGANVCSGMLCCIRRLQPVPVRLRLLPTLA